MDWITSSNPPDAAFPLLRLASVEGTRPPLGLTAATWSPRSVPREAWKTKLLFISSLPSLHLN